MVDLFISISISFICGFTLGYLFYQFIYVRSELSYDVSTIKEDLNNLNIRLERVFKKFE